MDAVSTVRPGHLLEGSRTERARRLKPSLDREYIVPVLLKSFAILELLREERSGLKIEQIHQQTGIAKTTVYRVVRTLVVSGYMRQSASGHYMVLKGMVPARFETRQRMSCAQMPEWCEAVHSTSS